MYYITMLTSLFEGAALIVDQHQPVVEKYYGRGKMITVVSKLLEECDRVVSKLVGGWEEERSLKRKVLLFLNAVIFKAHLPI
jgi:conserved oligomeric Golgi complex subunit 4